MKTLLTCTDGSIYAQPMYSYAAWAAKRLEARIHVLHMLDHHRERAEAVNLAGRITPGASEQLLAQLVDLEEAKGKLARIQGEAILSDAKHFLEAAGASSVTTGQKHGSLVEAIMEPPADTCLVALGKRGVSHGQARLHLGSNLERVIRACPYPILVTSYEYKPVERFLLAYDGGLSSKKALDFILDSPLLANLECLLVRVGHATPENEVEMSSAEKLLNAKGIQTTARIISGDPSTVFSSLVSSQDIRLLVMGAFGHSRVRNFLVGSTTTEMIRSCHIPVLMFR